MHNVPSKQSKQTQRRRVSFTEDIHSAETMQQHFYQPEEQANHILQPPMDGSSALRLRDSRHFRAVAAHGNSCQHPSYLHPSMNPADEDTPEVPLLRSSTMSCGCCCSMAQLPGSTVHTTSNIHARSQMLQKGTKSWQDTLIAS